jgi:hypothetical protein
VAQRLVASAGCGEERFPLFRITLQGQVQE